MTGVPAGWRQDRLKDVVTLRTSKDRASSEVADYLELEDIESGTGRILNRRNTLAVLSAVTEFKSGDVLFGKLRPYLEKYALADSDGKCTGEILAFAPERIHGPFLKWVVASSDFIARCNMLAYGAKMPRVNWPNQLSQFVLPLPPAPEQDRIAHFLDAACAAIDRARELKNAQMVALDLTLRAQLTSLVTRGTVPDRALAPSKAPWLGPLPATWRSASLKRLLAEPMEYGLNEAAEFEDRDCPRYIRITDFGQDGRLRDDTFRSLPAAVAAPALLSEEDILFARSGATVGKTFIFRDHPHPACFAGYLIRARPLRRVLRPMFLYYYTKSLAYEAWKDQVFSQATIQNISAVKYGYLLVPLPPVDEQDVIIGAVEARVAEITALRRNVEHQVEVLTAYRKSLIHECVTGIRRVTQEDLNRVLHHAVLPS